MRRALVVLAALLLGGCALRSDLRKVEDEIAAVRDIQARQDAERARQLADVMRLQQQMLDSIQSTRQAVRTLRGDLANDMYTPIRAAGAGRVVWAGRSPYDPAWIVIIAHSSELVTWYGHVDDTRRPPKVREGEYVNKGQVIAYEGNTGWSTGPHLHWAVQLGGNFVNPRLFLPR